MQRLIHLMRSKQSVQFLWRIEQVHRELKQTTGIERCQCRKGQSQRNHIACCILVWHRLIAFSEKMENDDL